MIMNYGVVYKFKPHNKINGTLFYCFEYFKFLQKSVDIKFYIIDITDKDLGLVTDIFSNKYNCTIDNIVPVRTIDLYKLKLDRTLVLDMHTFNGCREFLTGEVHCFSNESHEMFRYRNSRTVTYYGSYDYQNFDVFCYIKLNFEIFKQFDHAQPGVFVTGRNVDYLQREQPRLEKQFNKPVISKKTQNGSGNLFELIDSVHYIHLLQDTNNRIIPEAFYYNKQVTIEEVYTELDSVRLRYNDIKENGLVNYTLTQDDLMVKAMLQ